MVLQMELDEITLPNPNERARNRAIEGPEVVVDPIGKTHRLLDRLQLNDYPCSIVAPDRRRSVGCSAHVRALLALQWWQLRHTRNRYLLEDPGTAAVSSSTGQPRDVLHQPADVNQPNPV